MVRTDMLVVVISLTHVTKSWIKQHKYSMQNPTSVPSSCETMKSSNTDIYTLQRHVGRTRLMVIDIFLPNCHMCQRLPKTMNKIPYGLPICHLSWSWLPTSAPNTNTEQPGQCSLPSGLNTCSSFCRTRLSDNSSFSEVATALTTSHSTPT